LLGIVKAHKKSAFNIVKPYMDSISIHIITSSLDAMNESLQFLGVERPTFLRQNYPHILPHGVLHRDAEMIRHAYSAGDNEGSLGSLLINHNADILAEIFTREQDAKLKDTLKFYRVLVQGDNDTQVTVPRLITLCVAPLLVRIIVRLCKSESKEAILKALQRVHQFGHPELRRQSTKQDVIIFLKQHMLGIISELNDMLHDMHEKKTIKQKLEVISSYEALICLAGSTMAVYSPQVCCYNSPLYAAITNRMIPRF
jgi:serine/threonine-protein kinase ATR